MSKKLRKHFLDETGNKHLTEVLGRYNPVYVEWLEQHLEADQHETHCYVQDRFDAWKEGAVSRMKNMKLHDCPHKSRSRKADAWENGWETIDLYLQD